MTCQQSRVNQGRPEIKEGFPNDGFSRLATATGLITERRKPTLRVLNERGKNHCLKVTWVFSNPFYTPRMAFGGKKLINCTLNLQSSPFRLPPYFTFKSFVYTNELGETNANLKALNGNLN